jgi:hypothetical protein
LASAESLPSRSRQTKFSISGRPVEEHRDEIQMYLFYDLKMVHRVQAAPVMPAAVLTEFVSKPTQSE